MASIVIVTKQCYLLCEAINYIAINEVRDDEDESTIGRFFDKPKRGRKSKKLTKKQLEALKQQQFQIIIDFIPVNGISPSSGTLRNSNSSNATVGIKVTGRDRCLELFAHMVEQIREQIPDNKFLDEIVEKFIQETKDGPAT